MITISIDQSPPEFRPGEQISGRLTWTDTAEPTTSLETRLIWYTEGKGDQDVDVVASRPYEIRPNENSTRFQFTAPHRPFSFSGKLISLIWAVEVVTFPSKAGYREQISISNQGSEIILDKSFDDDSMIKPAVQTN